VITFFFFFFFPDFSERLATALDKQGMGADELAMRTNISRTTVKHWLTGTNEPRHRNLIHISDALDVSTDYLCGKN
jgi:transcriptional regulator with XRE-family HTH domain